MYAWLSFSSLLLVLLLFSFFVPFFTTLLRSFFTFSYNLFFCVHGYNVRPVVSTERNWYKTVYYHYSHSCVWMRLFVSYANNEIIPIYIEKDAVFQWSNRFHQPRSMQMFYFSQQQLLNRTGWNIVTKLNSLVFRRMLPPSFGFFFSIATPLFEVVMKWVHLSNERQGRGVLEKARPCQNSFTDNH